MLLSYYSLYKECSYHKIFVMVCSSLQMVAQRSRCKEGFPGCSIKIFYIISSFHPQLTSVPTPIFIFQTLITICHITYIYLFIILCVSNLQPLAYAFHKSWCLIFTAVPKLRKQQTLSTNLLGELSITLCLN